MFKDRRAQIRSLLTEKAFVSYEELFAMFPDVSQMTVRRDIDFLESRGEAIKVRGGARSMRFITESSDEAYASRLNENVHSKISIARKAAEMLEVGRSIFLDSGSTVQQAVQFIPNERFTFTTTSPVTALELCRIGQPAVNLVGGRLDHDYQSVSGLQAMRYLSEINIDTAVLCPSGLSEASGFTGGNYNECELKRAVVAKARYVIMLMDISKADRSLPYTFCTLSDVDCLICDAPLPASLEAKADAAGVRVIDISKEENQK